MQYAMSSTIQLWFRWSSLLIELSDLNPKSGCELVSDFPAQRLIVLEATRLAEIRKPQQSTFYNSLFKVFTPQIFFQS